MVKIEDLITLANAGVSADRLNALVDAELNKKDPEDKKDPEPEDKKDPEPEDKKDPEPDEKDKKIIDLENKIKKIQEENRRAGKGADATSEFEKARTDLINKISLGV